MIPWKYDNEYQEVQHNIKVNYILQTGRLDCIIKRKENAYTKMLKKYN
jgi:hypothetical protein